MIHFLNLYSQEKKDVSSGGAIVSNYTLDVFRKNYNGDHGRNLDYDDRSPFEVNNNIHYQNEIKYLKILEKYNITPKIIDNNDKELLLNGCGEILNQGNLPENWKDQITNIYEILKKENIYHNDIKFDNFTVKEGKIYLIDFGWSTDNLPGFPYLNLKESYINESIDFNDLLNKIYNDSVSLILNAGVRLNTNLNENHRNKFT